MNTLISLPRVHTFAMISTTIICSLLIPIVIYFQILKRRKAGFPLMRLPPEIRLLVFEHLLRDQDCLPEQKSHTTSATQDSSSTWSTLSSLSLSVSQPIRSLMPPPKPVFHALTLVNHQIRDEFLQIYRRLLPFRFTLDASHPDGAALWKISLPSLSQMRSVRLRILANPGIVGDFDPRQVTGSWMLRDRVFSLMANMTKMEDLRLSIQAVGNQLWNPIWLWHYTSQAFKVSELYAFRRMSFDLEGWNMKEPNHLERNSKGLWEWRCADNHFVQDDTDGPQPIKSFCAALYAECRICDPLTEEDE